MVHCIDAGNEKTIHSDLGIKGVEQMTMVFCGELLTISTVNELKQSLQQSLQKGSSIQLDASGVERADAAALQLLCAFIRDAKASGKTILWHKPTDALISSAKLIQVRKALDLSDNKN